MKGDLYSLHDEEQTEAALESAHRKAALNGMAIIAIVLLVILAVVLLLTGCSTLRSDQVETRPDGSKVESHQRIRNFWDSKTSLAKLRVSTTEKTQGITVGGYDTEVTSTNLNSLASDIVGAAVSAAIKSSIKP